jgi:hypothetical protein
MVICWSQLAICKHHTNFSAPSDVVASQDLLRRSRPLDYQLHWFEQSLLPLQRLPAERGVCAKTAEARDRGCGRHL